MAELIDRDSSAAEQLFKATVSDTGISVQFRDDTIIAFLKAPTAPEFLARHESQLLVDDMLLLRRVIHLLRTACVKTADWLPSSVGHISIHNVPDGSAWAAVLRLIHQNVQAFQAKERGLLIGLIEDAVKGVSWWEPNVDGAEHIAGIAHWLLSGMRGYSGDGFRKRALKVIAKIPAADFANFESVLRGNVEDGERRDAVAEELQGLIFNGMDGLPTARDCPDLAISVGERYLLSSDEDVDDERRSSHSLIGINVYFGIKSEREHDSFPASGIRGLWRHLLIYHGLKAVDFYIKVFNHSADWYAHPRMRCSIESPFEIEFTFSDGTQKRQWANGRLWGLYRGISVGPYILISMLMALESWLLEFGKHTPSQLDPILLDILRRTDNAALTAVVASVAIACPHACAEALLVILSAPDCIAMDRSRMALEGGSGISLFPTLGAENKVYESERGQSNALPHRRYDLEAAIMNLQFGSLAPRVQSILDKHLAQLPPQDQQTEQDKLWRIALHRMDLRQYTLSQSTEMGSPDSTGSAGETQEYMLINPKPIDADLQEIVTTGAARAISMNERLGIKLWGLHAFKREEKTFDPSQWAEKLAEAKKMDRQADEGDGSRDAPGVVAAVCVRDHWDSMEKDIVFLMGMCQGTFPDYRAQSKREIEEERNNAFVAVTRSRRWIFITYPQSKRMPWKDSQGNPAIKGQAQSQFITEMTSTP